MERIIIQNKHDIADMLSDVRRDLRSIRATHFDLPAVNEYSAIKCISFDIEKEPWLREIGALPKPGGWEYGYHRSNENNAKVNNALHAADVLILEILNYLDDCHVKPKALRFSELELSRFEIIKGGDVQ